MPLPSYGVLKGRVTGVKPQRDDQAPHYEVRMKAGTRAFKVPINVRSSEGAPELRFLVDDDFRHPLLAVLAAVPDGFRAVPDGRRGPALDYVRGNLFDLARMAIIPHDLPGEDNDLNDKLDHVMRRAINDDGIDVFAFGSRFPGGVHDIHMNQGNPSPGRFARDNGVFQDGGVLVHFTRQDRWTAIFLAFQTQSFHTDDATGHPLAVERQVEIGRQVRIVAALVNPVGPDDARETVTLLNTTARPIALRGWRLANGQNEEAALRGSLPPHAPLTVKLPSTLRLGNQGGTITLLDDRGLKIDGVSYTRDQARQEGRQLVF